MIENLSSTEILRGVPLWMTLFVALLLAPVCVAQTTQPSSDPQTLEFRANEAFTRNQFAVALPLLQKLEQQDKDQPDKLAPVQEQIRVCQKNIALAAAAVPAAQPGDQVEMSAEKRTPHPAPKAGETVAMAIKELGNFEYDADKGGNIPDDVKAMSGSMHPPERLHDPDGPGHQHLAVRVGAQPIRLLLRPAAADSAHDHRQLPQGQSGGVLSR